MSTPILGRKIKVETNLRCDFDRGLIPVGKYATQIVGDPQTTKAQGIYHGRLCYEAALKHYEELLKEQTDVDL